MKTLKQDANKRNTENSKKIENLKKEFVNGQKLKKMEKNEN